jgi:hypothetical protein
MKLIVKELGAAQEEAFSALAQVGRAFMSVNWLLKW